MLRYDHIPSIPGCICLLSSICRTGFRAFTSDLRKAISLGFMNSIRQVIIAD